MRAQLLTSVVVSAAYVVLVCYSQSREHSRGGSDVFGMTEETLDVGWPFCFATIYRETTYNRNHIFTNDSRNERVTRNDVVWHGRQVPVFAGYYSIALISLNFLLWKWLTRNQKWYQFTIRDFVLGTILASVTIIIFQGLEFPYWDQRDWLLFTVEFATILIIISGIWGILKNLVVQKFRHSIG